MIGAPFDHLCDVLCLFVNRHGSDDAAMRGGGGQLDLDRTGFGNLTVKLLQQRRILRRQKDHRKAPFRLFEHTL